jgi:hypothetical protein
VEIPSLIVVSLIIFFISSSKLVAYIAISILFIYKSIIYFKMINYFKRISKKYGLPPSLLNSYLNGPIAEPAWQSAIKTESNNFKKELS